MKWLSKLHYYVLMPLLCLSLAFSSYAIPSYANETSSGTSDTWTMDAETFLYYAFNGLAKELSSPYVVWNSFGNLTYDGFNYWLQNTDNGEHYHVLDDGEVVGHGGAGYTRDVDKINNSTSVDVSPELQQLILNYVHYEVGQNPLGYKPCYIYSYNFLSPSAFSTYQQYVTTKNYLKNSEGRYSVILLSQGNILVSQYLNQSQNLGFVGTTNNGSFVSVQPYVNWQTLGQNMLQPNATINTGGVMSQNVNTNWFGYSNLKNIATPNGNNKIIMSPNETNELVYVFETLNAYKNYNSGYAQPYYMTSEGMNNSNWSVNGSGTINTGTMNNSSSYYNSVVNGVDSNWTPEQIIKLVDTVVKNNNGSGNASGNDSDSDGWLDLGIFGDIGKAIAKVIGAIITAIASIFEEIIGIVTQVSETLLQGVIFEFLSAFIGWLPDEIIALLTALFSVAVLFALVKLIREAF